jgi:hypothetical protein
LAVYYLKKEDVNSALDLLKKSEELCETNELGQAMTFNNMACYYRRYAYIMEYILGLAK